MMDQSTGVDNPRLQHGHHTHTPNNQARERKKGRLCVQGLFKPWKALQNLTEGLLYDTALLMGMFKLQLCAWKKKTETYKVFTDGVNVLPQGVFSRLYEEEGLREQRVQGRLFPCVQLGVVSKYHRCISHNQGLKGSFQTNQEECREPSSSVFLSSVLFRMCASEDLPFFAKYLSLAWRCGHPMSRHVMGKMSSS